MEIRNAYLGNMGERILIVDDDAAVCWSASHFLNAEGYVVHTAPSVGRAQWIIRHRRPDLVVSDLRMPGTGGIELLEWIRTCAPDLPVLMMSAYGSLDTLAQCTGFAMRGFLSKPLDAGQLAQAVRSALRDDSPALMVTPDQLSNAEGILHGSGPDMHAVNHRVAIAVTGRMPVLIRGPCGSGRRTAALAIHRHAFPCGAPLVRVSASSLLSPGDFRWWFGDSALGRGSDWGKISEAMGGSLLIEDIGETPEFARVGLISVLDRITADGDGSPAIRVMATVSRVGSDHSVPRLLAEVVSRISGIAIDMPSLAERKNDFIHLLTGVMCKISKALNRPLLMHADAVAYLGHRQWVGNLRELESVVAGAAIHASSGTIDVRACLAAVDEVDDDAVLNFRRYVLARFQEFCGNPHGSAFQEVTGSIEAYVIREALRHAGSIAQAADLLGIHRTTLVRRAEVHGIQSKDLGAED